MHPLSGDHDSAAKDLTKYLTPISPEHLSQLESSTEEMLPPTVTCLVGRAGSPG